MAKMADLFKTTLKNIVIALQEYQPEKIILFGSAAEGKFGAQSDLDLFILKKTKKRFMDRIGEVLDLVAEFEIPVDPVVYTPQEFSRAKKENRMFIEEVLGKGKVIYEAA